MKIRRRDVVIVFCVTVMYCVLLFIVMNVVGSQYLISVICVLTLVLALLFSFEFYRRIQAHLISNQSDIVQTYKQLEALHSIHSVLEITPPLPPMRGWAISPDFAVLLIAAILENKPKMIVETGSGVSTLLSAYCLKALGSGQILSLDHDKNFANISQMNVAKHGLNNLAKVQYAPLTFHTIDDRSWQWYDLTFLDCVDEIDVLIIDGPPQAIQALSRYPALPLLLKRLSSDTIILLDDAGREDELEIVDRWLLEFPEFESEFIETEKGAIILRRQRKK